jgi:hypothetical protein
MHYASYVYKDGGHELEMDKNGVPFEGGQGPEEAVVPYMEWYYSNEGWSSEF